jgi:NIPSNAP
VIYELRVYDVVPGKLASLNDRFENVTLAFFEKHGIKVVGFWTDVIGTSNRLTYMLAYEDLAHREKAWTAFAGDQERLARFAETERDGPLVARVTNTLMAPTKYSPME